LIVTACSENPTKIQKDLTNRSLVKQEKKEFNPKGIPPGSEAKYNISFTMDVEGNFDIQSNTFVKNTSDDAWDKIIFYFIPNMFTKMNSPNFKKTAIVKIGSIKLNGKQVNYTLEKDTLTIPLGDRLKPNKGVEVEIKYDYTLPEEGYRFTKKNDNYYLAQWYPMVATYRDGWNKEEFLHKGETYHTSFSDFEIKYEIPNGFTIISTSQEDKYPTKNTGSLTAHNVKEFFIAIIKEHNIVKKSYQDTEIRVIGIDDRKELHQEVSNIVIETFDYFHNTIGSYPYKQLDIILDQLGMEYPGVVTASSIQNNGAENIKTLKRIVVHEIAHQWFYGIISNDPYNNAWLDEGITELATYLFYVKHENKEFSFEGNEDLYKDFPLPVNLPLESYTLNTQSSYIYGKSATRLGEIFQKNGGSAAAEDFLKSYFELYQFNEVDTNEFVRYLRYYLNLKDYTYFDDWLLLDSE
jgi:hypothetical protein